MDVGINSEKSSIKKRSFSEKKKRATKKHRYIFTQHSLFVLDDDFSVIKKIIRCRLRKYCIKIPRYFCFCVSNPVVKTF
jgi:hypothetical protein